MPLRAPRQPILRDELTERQREVLDLIARGYTNFEIAQAIGVSLEGAKYHVREILARLDVESREEAAELWRREQRPRARFSRAFASLLGGHGLRFAVFAAAGVAVAVVGVAVLVAVVGPMNGSDAADDPPPALSPTVTPSPTASATATASPTPAPVVPLPGSPSLGVHPPGTRVGLDIVDRVIELVEQQDAPAFDDLLVYQPWACTNEQYHILPSCPADVPEGTEVPSVFTFQCEAKWVRERERTEGVFWHPALYRELRLLAVVDTSAHVPMESRPAADYWVLFIDPAAGGAPGDALPVGIAVGVVGEGIVAFGSSCGFDISRFYRQYAGRGAVVLPPR